MVSIWRWCFEGIRAYSGHVFKLKEHIDRLFDAARAIDLKFHIQKKLWTLYANRVQKMILKMDI